MTTTKDDISADYHLPTGLTFDEKCDYLSACLVAIVRLTQLKAWGESYPIPNTVQQSADKLRQLVETAGDNPQICSTPEFKLAVESANKTIADAIRWE